MGMLKAPDSLLKQENKKINTMKKNLHFVSVYMLATALAFMCTISSSAAIQANKTYRISSALSGVRALFPQNSSPKTGTAVLAWTYTDVPAQLWTAESAGDGTFTLRNAYTGLYLSLSAAPSSTSSQLVQSSSVTTTAKWVITESSQTAGTYSLVQTSSQTEYALTLNADSDGAKPVMSEISDPAAPSEGQSWSLVEVVPDLTLSRDVKSQMGEAYLSNNFRSRSNGYYSFGNGGWGEAEVFETMLDAYETSGDQKYLDAFKEGYKYFIHCIGSNWLILKYDSDYNWFGHDFNDDVMWMILAAVRAYHLTGITSYLSLAKSNFDAIYKRAYDKWGMLQWAMQSGSANGTNSCINGPAEVAACYIAMGQASKVTKRKYYNIAKELYDKQRRFLFNQNTGEVYDSFTWDESTNMPSNYNKWVSTYNQGTMLGAAVMLYDYFGDEKYKRDADKIAECTKSRLCDSYGIVNVCQNVSGTYCGFKGILMRYLRRYIIDMQHPELADWLRDNALRAYNNRNSYGITSSAWLTKSAENWITTNEKNDDGTFKNFKDEPFGNSTAVSAVFNAPLSSHNIIKDGFKTIEAEDFDYVRGIYVSADDASSMLGVTNLANSYYTVYKNVNFGSRAARSVTLVARAEGAGTTIEIHADSINGTTLATVSLPDSSTLSEVKAEITPIDGQHDIYIVYKKSISTAKNFFLDKIEFSSDAPALVADLTDCVVTSNAQDSTSNDSLFDNRVTTTVLTSGQSATFYFNCIAPATLKGYALANSSAGKGYDPKSWTLYGLNENSEWETIDSRSGEEFGTTCTLRSFSVSTDKTYTQFRLDITENGGNDSISIGEWQLYGTAISANDITADGGTLTEGDSTAIDKSAATATSSTSMSYTSKSNYQPTCYSITAPATGTAPSSWTLYGYAERTWQVLDSREGEAFTGNGCTQFYKISDAPVCQRFKLEINGDSASTSIAEWQVFGPLKSSATLYTDITCSVGKLTSSDNASAESLAPAIDDDANTSTSIKYDTSGTWIEYYSPTAARLTAYSVCAGNNIDAAPYSWQLMASDDGQEWTRLNLVFRAQLNKKGEVKTSTISNSKTYKYFRLVITRPNNSSSSNVEIGDFQLYGRCIADSSLVSGATMTAEFPNSDSDESVDKAADSDINTKFLCNYYGGAWISADMTEAACANVYAISSANDYASRDPQSWVLQGSDDGSSWTTLDSRSGESFYGRYITQLYTFNNSTKYKLYRLQITENGGDELCQLSELQLFGYDDNTTGIIDITRSSGKLAASITDGGNTLCVSLPAAARLSVYASDGAEIMSESLPAGESRINFSAEAKGTYIIKAVTSTGLFTAKIAK